MASLQFIGRADVVQAVRDRGIETWGLFQGRQFITAGESCDMLDQFLEKLEPGGSGPVYTLKVYKDEHADDITDKTECNGSFNFKLSESRGTLSGQASNQAVIDRLDRLEEIIAGGDDQDDDKGNTITDILIGYLADPAKLATIFGAFRSVRQPGYMQVVEPAAVGAVEQRRESPAFAQESYTDPRTDRLSIVLDKLDRADPKILEHLEKLATLAETKPDFFKLLITQLDAF